MLELNVYFWKIFNLLMQRDRKVRHRVGCSCCCWCCFDQHIIFIHNCLYVSQWVNKSTLHITKLDVENWLHYVILMTTKSMTSFFFFVRSESSHSVMEKKGMYVFFFKFVIHFMYGKSEAHVFIQWGSFKKDVSCRLHTVPLTCASCSGHTNNGCLYTSRLNVAMTSLLSGTVLLFTSQLSHHYFFGGS